MQSWDADFVAFSGHKMLGPTGIGVLYGREEILESMPPFLGGGSMIDRVEFSGFTPGEVPARFEAGTPPIVEAIGLNAAVNYLSSIGLSLIHQHERTLTAHTLSRLESEIAGLRVFGPTNPKHRAGIISFAVQGVNAQDLAAKLDVQGIAIRAGHHCAMPLHEKLGVPSTCRASFYLYNTAQEIDYFIDALKNAVAKLR